MNTRGVRLTELRRHGHELSTGTLQPILHGLLTQAKEWRSGGEGPVYRAAPAVRKARTAANTTVRELFGDCSKKRRIAADESGN